MNTARTTALLCFLVAGCAVQLSEELDLQTFDQSAYPAGVDVTGQAQSVTCEMTIPDGAGGAGGAGSDPNIVKYAACSFKSPTGKRQGCLATSAANDVWSCDLTIPADSEQNTWVLEYVFAESEDGAKLFATGAEMVADAANVLEGEAGRVDIAVTSGNADTTAPAILTFNAVPANVEPGSTVTCTLTTDEDPIELMGCSLCPTTPQLRLAASQPQGPTSARRPFPQGPRRA